MNAINNGNASDEAQFFVTMLSTRLLWPDKEMDAYREGLVRIIDEAIEEHGIFKLEEDYIAILKRAKENRES